MRSSLVLLLLAQVTAYVFAGVASDCRVASGDSGEIRGLWNLTEPFGIYLSPIYNGSFAHETMKERIPAIVKTIIDVLNRDIEEIVEKHGAEAREEALRIVANLEVLKNEILKNAPLTNLTLANSAADRDANLWNDELARRRELDGPNLSYFLSQFLLAESYTFRRAAQEFALTENLKNYDFFGKQKQRLLTNSAKSLPLLAHHAMTLVNKSRAAMSDDEAREELTKLLKLSLWGNRFDLAVSSGGDISQEGDPLELVSSFDKDLLVDQARVAWDILNAPRAAGEPAIVDIVLDNSGYELFNDLCLAAVLVSRGLATTVRFHAKQIPWYVSDVNVHDFHWVIGYMRGSSNADLREFGDFCALQVERGSWTIEADPFWTTFHGFAAMKKEAPALYKKLSEAKLVIFKGDLNYRKLMNDVNWENTISLDTALFHLDFKPTNVLSLRTVKSLPCVGLTLEKVRLWKADKKKMGDGTFGVINASTKNAKCNCA